MYKLAANVVKAFLSLFGRIKVYQKDNLPKSGSYVIACTHTGFVDILWLGIATMPTQIHYMAKKELFQSKFTKWLMESLHAFPVDRENPGPSAIKTPRKLLKEGKVVGIFPSGTRSSEGAPLKRGAVTIAVHADVPIVPAAYVGPNNFKDLFKRIKPRLIYGEPIYLPEGISKKEAMDVLMEELDKEMNLLQEKIQ
ncbi:lysophospholipid acyltransferase family protein [Ornithinibacillus bavariensis]|uniref:1-acyl-sn-glycerol-3-phosphate acyltransferase n=1 Tax=Ornithinibacillus bavariensis TaxID=545502 RepID=A0A920C754_9BACI|nr:lysophospholipid acyltransferase family protein [Ornithinibacillus bavariensis]GIO27298.1 1-acyl-sn-glycerol-3-phosphate acyltransferase [Ornithinibacillus bavariensis]HAM81905.1 1-acyl-sn-glycerol-3-phosphate acyltransferase [Ornithinibacillus sp.]